MNSVTPDVFSLQIHLPIYSPVGLYIPALPCPQTCLLIYSVTRYTRLLSSAEAVKSPSSYPDARMILLKLLVLTLQLPGPPKHSRPYSQLAALAQGRPYRNVLNTKLISITSISSSSLFSTLIVR